MGRQIWAIERLSRLGDLMFYQKTLQKMWYMNRCMSWQSCQSPVAHSCGLLNHPNSFCGGMCKLNAQSEADSLLYLLGRFECEGHTVHMLTQRHHRPHWLVQWSRHCSHMLILVHSLWLPGYITVSQTALILLTMTWFFPDRPRIYINQREDKIVYNQILNYLVK